MQPTEIYVRRGEEGRVVPRREEEEDEEDGVGEDGRGEQKG